MMQIDLSANLLDIWPTYEGSYQPVQFGDHVFCDSAGYERDGMVHEITYNFTSSSTWHHPPIEVQSIYVVLEDDDGNLCSLVNPRIFYRGDPDE